MKPPFSMGKNPPFSHGKNVPPAEQRHASGVAARGHGDAGHLRPGPGSLAPAVVRRRRGGLGPKEGKVVLELGIFVGGMMLHELFICRILMDYLNGLSKWII